VLSSPVWYIIEIFALLVGADYQLFGTVYRSSLPRSSRPSRFL